MTDTTLTYEALYDILRREKIKPELQKLDNNFYEQVGNYIKDKINTLESQKQKSSIFAQKEIEKTEKQIDNVKKIIKELYEKRESKLIQLALSAVKVREFQDVQELLPEEKNLFDNIMSLLKSSRNEIINNLLEKPKVIKMDAETKLVRFVAAVPKFIGDDLNEYGPF